MKADNNNRFCAMSYYYLTPENKPSGPFSKNELFFMLRSGELSSTTLVAHDGGEAWVALGHLWDAHRQSGLCPFCKKTVAPQTDTSGNTRTPRQCPHCEEVLRPVYPECCVSCIAHALSRLFCTQGRASRREFWATLFLYALLFPALIILTVAGLSGAEGNPGFIAKLFIVIGAWYGYLAAIYSLTMRRMHDAGFKGTLTRLLFLYMRVLIALQFIWIYFGQKPSSVLHYIQEIVIFMVFFGFMLGIINLFLCSIASDKKPNAFGPCVL